MVFDFLKIKGNVREQSMTFVKRYKRDKDGELEKQLLIFARYQKLVNESKWPMKLFGLITQEIRYTKENL